jgi:YHS domain-containing protein
MVKDEACQTYIPEENALREVIDGHEQFFCSKECRTKFLEERKRAR